MFNVRLVYKTVLTTDDDGKTNIKISSLLALRKKATEDAKLATEEMSKKLAFDIEMMSRYEKNITSATDKTALFDATLGRASQQAQAQADALRNGTMTSKAYATQQQSAMVATTGLTFAQKAATIGAKALGVAINMALTFGIGFVIDLIVQGITKLVNAQQEAIDKANEFIETYKQSSEAAKSNISSLTSMSAEFNKLSKGVNENGENISLTNEEYIKFNDLLKQIVGISPDIVQGYDNEGKAVLNYKDALDLAIKSQETLLSNARREYLGKGEDIFNGKQSEYEKAVKEAQKVTSKLGVAGGFFNTSVRQGLMDVFKELKIDFKYMVDTWDSLSADQIEQIYNRSEDIINLMKTKPEIFSEEERIEVENILNSLSGVNTKINNISQEQINYLSEWSKTQDWFGEIPVGAIDEFTSGLNNVNDPLKSYNENLNTANKYGKEFSQALSSDTSQKIIALSKGLSDGSVSTEEYVASIEDLKSSWTGSQDVLDSIILFFNSLNNAQQGTDVSNSLSDTISNITSQTGLLSKALKEQNTNGEISQETYAKLISKGEDYAKLVDVVNGKFILSTGSTEKYNNEQVKLAIQTAISQGATEDFINVLKDLIIVNDSLIESSKEVASVYDVVNTVEKEMQENKSLSASTVASLLTQDAELIKYLKIENGLVVFNTKAFLSDAQAKLKASIAAKELKLNDLTEMYAKTAEMAYLSAAGTLAYAGALLQQEEVMAGLRKQLEIDKALLSGLTSFEIPTFSGSGKETDPWLDAYNKAYAELQHLRAMDQLNDVKYYSELEALDKKYFGDNAKYIDEHKKNLEELYKLQKTLTDKRTSDIEHEISLLSRSEGTEQEQINLYRRIQEELTKILTKYRDMGLDINHEYIQSLQNQWYGFQDAIDQVLESIVSKANDALDNIQNVYTSLKNAAKEFAESGFITVDTFKTIAALGTQYLAYLVDENGQLVINEQAVHKVIAAKTQQVSVETALNYVQALRSALTNNDTITLNNLLNNTEATTKSTWDLVYAQLALLDLNGQQYQDALTRINTLRSLADTAVESIGKITGTLSDSLTTQEKALDDLLKHVIEMIKWEVGNQIDGLKEQIKQYRSIVDLQKESLKLAKEKDNYDKTVSKKSEEIAKKQAKINQLSLDDSREAQAEKKKLEEELGELQESLSDFQSDHQYDIQVETLDKMADAYEEEKNKEIEILEKSISSYEKLYRLAIDRISNQWNTLYQDLIHYNFEAGSTIESEIVSAWDNASLAVQKYGGYLEAILQTQNQIAAMNGAGTSSPNIVGNVGTYDTSGSETVNKVKEIVAQMKANSAKWTSSDESKRQQLTSENLSLGSQLGSLLGRPVIRGDDGVWYLDTIGGKRLYDVYHKGGIVGNEPSKKDSEILALLEKKELVLDEPKKKVAYEAIDMASRLVKYTDTFDSQKLNVDNLPIIQSALMNKSFNGLNKNINYRDNGSGFNIEEISVTAPILVTETITKEALKEHSRTIVDISLGALKEGFGRSGI